MLRVRPGQEFFKAKKVYPKVAMPKEVAAFALLEVLQRPRDSSAYVNRASQGKSLLRTRPGAEYFVSNGVACSSLLCSSSLVIVLTKYAER